MFARSGKVPEALGREEKRKQTIGRSAGADGAIGLNTRRRANSVWRRKAARKWPVGFAMLVRLDPRASKWRRRIL